MNAPLLELRLFGTPEAYVSGQAMAPLRSRKGLLLLALLALGEGRARERSRIVALLWPESGETEGYVNLRRTLTDLRRALGPAAECILADSPRTLRLDHKGAGLVCDLIEFDTTSDPATATALYRGPLLEGYSDEWVMLERAAREVRCLELLEAAADGAIAREDHREATRLLTTAIRIDPLREGVRRRYFLALARGGNRTAALAAYEEFRGLLHQEIGVDPEAETEALMTSLRKGSLSFPSLMSFRSVCKSPALPAPITPLIGRTEIVQDALRLFETTRLVTLTGLGGIGKTRLALATAQATPLSTVFVDLAPLTDPERLWSYIAVAVGGEAATPDLTDLSARDMRDTVCASLQHSAAILLLLDNCEHLLVDCAAATSFLLSRCPGVRILATSRHPLGVAGEAVLPVPPLPATEAAMLFRSRARAACGRPLATDTEADVAIDEIIRRTDGIPLAVEMAAAWATALSPAQIATRLAERFPLALTDATGALGRHQTLRGVLEWSVLQMRETDRRLLERLSVFADGWILEAAVTVCAGEGLTRAEIAVSLGRLAQQALVIAEPAKGRYRLLETVRQFAAERLGQGGTESPTILRHTVYFARHLRTAAQRRLTGEGNDPFPFRERANLYAALDRAAPPLRLRLAAAFGPFWYDTGEVEEGTRRLVTALAEAPLTEGRSRRRDRARALSALGDLYAWSRALALAEECHVQADVLWREIERVSRFPAHRREAACAYRAYGYARRLQGDTDGARRLLREALDRFEAISVFREIAYCLVALGDLALDQEEFAEAERYYRTYERLAADRGDIVSRAAALRSLGVLAAYQRCWPDAREWFLNADEASQCADDQRGIAAARLWLAELACGAFVREGMLSERETALAFAMMSVRLVRAIAGSELIFAYLCRAASVTTLCNDNERATEWFAEAANLLRERRYGGIASVRFLGTAAIGALTRGDARRAVILHTAETHWRDAIVDAPTNRHDATVTAALGAETRFAILTGSDVRRWQETGQALSLESAVTLARGVFRDSSPL